MAAHLRLLNHLASELVAERQRLLHRLQPELLKLVTALVEQVVGESARQSGDVIERTLEQALEALGEAGGIRAYLHPADLALLTDRWGEAGGGGLPAGQPAAGGPRPRALGTH